MDMAVPSYNFTSVLSGERSIECAVRKAYNSPLSKEMKLYENGIFKENLRFITKSDSTTNVIYTFTFESEIVPGRLYELSDGKNEFSPLDLTFLTTLPEFEKKYRYDGELGAIYAKDKTIFRVFSPLSDEMLVKVIKGQDISYYPLHRLPSGVFEGEVAGDLEGAGYIYIVRINGHYTKTVDPYAKSLGVNSRIGYIVDVDKIKDIPSNEEMLPPFDDPCQAVIYELDVRDMTSLSKMKDRGTYAALSREGEKDENGNPLGMDYISSLGVSHVQLLPVFDFQTIPDDNPFSAYNWGYDPEFFFAPEGSYSTDPSDPYARMRELKMLISTFHKHGIRVNMDVVFNHTFQVLSNALNKLCPNYYYRFNDEGYMSEASGCGNDTESRRYMMRKLIVDCLVFFTEVYGMDGFRFDLMGLIDSATINAASQAVRDIKPNAMIYGEGWNMPTAMPDVEKSSMDNASKLKTIGFFNDRFRDVSKGKTFGSNLNSKGYLTGDENYIDGFKHVYMGSVISFAFPPLFVSPSQSINYMECHDNATLFDKLKSCFPEEEESELLKRMKLLNACVILSLGVPFIHAGQEVGHSKKGINNSYNAGDEINGFDYKEAYQRKDMIRYFRDVIRLKKKYPSLCMSDKKEITKRISFENLPNGALYVKYEAKDNEPEMAVIINPSRASLKYQFSKYYRIVFNEAGFIDDGQYSQLLLVNGISVIVAIASNI
jgi:pullulanase